MIDEMYRKMYTTLFKAVTIALRLIEDGRCTEAEMLLKEAQQETEEIYILWEEQTPE